jgi:hypothetical protein
MGRSEHRTWDQRKPPAGRQAVFVLNIGIVAGEGDFTPSRKTARWGRRFHPIPQKSRSGDPGASTPSRKNHALGTPAPVLHKLATRISRAA